MDGVDLKAEVAKWVSQIDQLTDQQKIQLDKLINGNLTPKQKVALYNQLKENLPDSFDIPIHYVADDAQDLIDRVKASKSRLSKSTNSFGVEEVNPNTLNEINSFFDEMQIDTEEEYNMWLNIASATDDAKEAMDKYRKAVEATSKEKVGVFDQATFAEQISKLDNLQNAYNSFRANVNNNETKINLDISDVESLREDFKEINDFDFDEFELVVTSDTSSADDIQKAFDDALTALVRYKINLQDVDDTNKDMIRTQLEMEGATKESAERVVETQAARKKATKADIEALGEYASKLSDTSLSEDEAKQAAEDFNGALDEEAQKLQIDKAYIVEYMILKGQANGGIWNIDLQGLIDEYERLGLNCDKLREYLGLKNQYNSSGNFVGQFKSYEEWKAYQNSLNAAEDQIVENSKTPPTVDWDPYVNDAGGAGGDAGDAYVEEFEKELSKLEDLRDRGLISEKEFLDRQKALIDKFFKDRAEYAEEYAKRLYDYLNGMKSHYDGVISGVISLLDHRISQVQKNRDSVISALEEEKEAALEAYQAQIDAIQEQIDAIDEEIDAIDDQIDELDKEIDKRNEVIDGLNKQIDAINEANEARDRAINLQKAEYELQRMQNQRTKLVYTGEVGQMRYERDEQGVRNAQESLKDAQDEMAIAAIEKQIKLIEEEIELIEDQKKALQEQQEELRKQQEQLQKQQEAIQKQMEATEKYYDKLIKQQEKMFDEMISKLEETKAKWEELAAIDELAKNWGLVADEMEAMGFTVEDVLNDVPGAFEAFRDKYLAVLSAMHEGDKGYQAGLQEFAGEIKSTFGTLGEDVGQAKQPLEEVGTAAETAAGKVQSFGTNASTAASGAKDLKESTDGIAENLNSVNDTVNFEGLKQKLIEVYNEIQKIIDLIGTSATALPNSLVAALNGLNTLNLDEFKNSFSGLSSEISKVVGLLTGEGGGAATEDAADTSGNTMGDTKTGGGGSLKKALKDVQATAASTIGGGGGDAADTTKTETENAEGDGTVVGAFQALNTEIGNASTAIGTKDSNEDSADLIGSITNLGIKNAEVLTGGDKNGANGVIGDWKKFNTELKEAEGHITKMAECLENLEDSYQTELTVTLTIVGGEYTGTAKLNGKKGHYSFNVLPPLGLPSGSGTWESFLKHGKATGTAKLSGSALMSGDWGLKKGGKTLVGELGPEIVNNCDFIWRHILKNLLNCWKFLRDSLTTT